jgi:hypothetical protein
MQLQRQITPRQFVLLMLAGVVLGAGIWAAMQRAGWRELPREGGVRRWQRGNVIHLDTNGDGIVDEEQIRFDRPNHAIIRRDTKFNGWFDLRYELQSGVATHIEKIHERAPRH